jgi:hypothetical protein
MLTKNSPRLHHDRPKAGDLVIPIVIHKNGASTRINHRPGSRDVWQFIEAGWEIAELKHQAL